MAKLDCYLSGIKSGTEDHRTQSKTFYANTDNELRRAKAIKDAAHADAFPESEKKITDARK